MKPYQVIMIVLLVLWLATTPAGAAAVTNPATDITGGKVWFHGTADPAATVGWFQWGGVSGTSYYWSTPNQSVTGGAAFDDYQYGPPLLTCSTYYVIACDDTGCGNQFKFTTPAPQMVNITHYGTGVITMMRSGMNITKTMESLVKPYTSITTAPVTYFLLFFFIFIGLWLRPKDTFIPMIMAMIAGGVIWGTAALGTIPPEMMDIGQGLFYAAVAGFAFSLFTK